MKKSIGRAAMPAALLAAALCVSGCVTLGRSFPTVPISGITVGKTTRDNIHETFGEPYRTGIEDGDPTWTYLLYRFSAFGSEKTRDLYIRFDASGKVKSYAFNTNEPDAAPR